MIEIIALLFILYGILLLIYISINKKCNYSYPEKKVSSNYAILIPARNESKVIENLLISIEKQSFPISSRNVYVIIENPLDPTVDIVNKHGMNIIYRKDLSKRRKCYALADAIEEIIKNNKYDAYFIFDADNILDKDYFKNMNEVVNKGYDIAEGYRNAKNGNDSIIAACSSLVFSMVNTLGNSIKVKKNKVITISGTGFFISGNLVQKWGTYPFHSLTEDYELSLYATLHNLKTTYDDKAIFYDEQPETFKKSIIQRSRWIKGYFEARKKYIPKIRKKAKYNNSDLPIIIGVKPYISMVIGIFIYILYQISNLFLDFKSALIKLIIIIFMIYIFLLIFTIILLIKEKDKLNLNKEMKIKSIFVNPLFIISYIICAIRAFLIKDLQWEIIEHGK